MIETANIPANLDAERSVLGSLLRDSTHWPEAESMLAAGDFHLAAHRLIYLAMASLSQHGKAIDHVTVCEQLGDKLRQVGGAAFVSSLSDLIPRRPSIASWCRIVREKSQLRQLITLCDVTAMRASEQAEEADSLLGDVHAKLVDIIADHAKDDSEWLIEFTDREWAKVEAERKSTAEMLGLDAGMPELNRRTGGIMPGEFWLIGAKTSDGKSALGTEIAARNASAGKSIAVFSTEMPRGKILRRVWTQNLPFGRASWKMRDVRRMTPEEFEQFRQVKNWAAGLTIKVEDHSPLDIRTFDAKARLMVRRDKIDLIILDHIHEMTAPIQNIRERFIAIAEGLRRFVRETGVPIVGLAQFPKPDKGNTNRRPTKHDFGETGALEQKANVCLLIYRPKDEQDLPTGEDEIIIGKHRDGAVSILPVRLNTHSLRYEPREVSA